MKCVALRSLRDSAYAQQTILRRAVPVERYACSGATTGHKLSRQPVPILEQDAAQVLPLEVPPTPPLGRGQ